MNFCIKRFYSVSDYLLFKDTFISFSNFMERLFIIHCRLRVKRCHGISDIAEALL